MLRPVMYIFVNKGLGMSAPKLAGMVLQAGILSYQDGALREPSVPGLWDAWLDGGMMKVVLEAEDTEQLRNIEDYLTKAGYRTFSVIDEGRTEVRPFSLTTMAVELVDKADPKVAETFGQFKTLKDPKPQAEEKSEFWDRQIAALRRSLSI